jgi:hypothetical protein
MKGVALLVNICFISYVKLENTPDFSVRDGAPYFSGSFEQNKLGATFFSVLLAIS